MSFDNVEASVFLIDEILELNDTEDAAEELRSIKDNNRYWASFSGKKLDEELEKLKSM